jgi:iron complex outermembrane recepter protein
MKRLLLTLSSIILLSCVAFAQGGEVSGKITNGESQPLQGVAVHLLNTNYGAVTDASGTFTMTNVPSGEYTLFISAVGYASIQQPVSAGTPALSITLTESVTQLDDVVVTAQKTEEPLQRIPFSISALSARKVNEYRLWNVRDITAIAPNVFASNPGDNRNVTSIRGITSTSYDPAVATYIDGVNQFSLDTYIAQLFDVERIEVLRGPQGTLYGRNAMAGVINIITKEPGNTTRGFVEANIGNYGQQRYGFGVRTPLVANKLFLGVAGMYDANSGFYKNDFNNSDFDKKYNITGNYYLKYLATSKLAVTLNVKHSINRNDGAFPLAGSVESALSEPFRVNQNATTTLVDNVFNSSLNINYAGDVVNFTSLTTYQSNYRIYDDPIDGDFSPIDAVTIKNNFGKDWNNVKVFTQEFKVSSPAASTSSLKWTAGAYLFSQDNPVKQETTFGGDAILTTSEGDSKGMAFYGQATYSPTEKLEITAGVRYDYEKKKQNVLGIYFSGGVPQFEIRPDTSASTSFSAFSPKLSFAYHPTPNNTIYITGSRGFRAGGLTQLSSDPSQAPLYSYKPEYSTNAELGSKNSFLSDRLQLNVAAYYIKVNDAQVPTLILPDAITVTRNAGELTSIGAELEVSATPLKGLQLDYAAGINKATYDDLVLPQNGEQVNFDGNRQIYTPQHTSMLAAQYSYTLKSTGITLIARGEWMNLGTQYFDLANNIKQSGYSIFNARAGASFRNFELMFWGRNLSDETYIAYAYDFGATHLGNPRNYGATFRWNF